MDRLQLPSLATSLLVGAAVASPLLANYIIGSRRPGTLKDTRTWSSDNHGGELVAEVLANHGVKWVFTLTGGHIAPILVGSKAKGIRVIDVRHEVNAVFAADAVSRLSGVPGVACVTAGPGLSNTITAIKNAQLAQSPLILLGGATADIVKGRGSLQDIDQVAMMKPHVKWMTHVSSVKQIVPAIEMAFQMAQSGVPGPVLVEIPLDILYSQKLGSKALLDRAPTGNTLVEWGIRTYMRHYLNGVFDQHEPVSFHHPLPFDFPMPSSSQVASAASKLAKAQRPVLVIGSQAMLVTQKADELGLAVESMGIPTFLSSSARGLLGKKNAQQFIQKRGNALREADVVILAGVVQDFRLDYGNQVSRKAYLICANRSVEDLNKNRSPSLAIHGDPCHFLIGLAAELKAVAPAVASQWDDWRKRLQEREVAREQEIKAMANNPTTKYLNVVAVCQEIEAGIDNDSVLVADGGDFVGTAAYIVKPRGPLRWLDPGLFGTLGVGAGFAIGAKLVKPNSEVWLLWGDGASGYSLMELDTCRRHGIPFIAVIGNDACWSQIFREQIELLNDDVGCMLEYTKYHEVAEALGAKGIVVDDLTKMPQALADAKTAAAAGQSVVINVLLGSSDFRKGSLSM